MKRRAVIYAPEAGSDLDRIYDIIAEASSAITADRLSGHSANVSNTAPSVAPAATMCGLSFASSDLNAVSASPSSSSPSVVILRVFYGGADWQDDLAEGDAR